MFHYLSFIKLSWANQNFLEPLASSLIVFVYKRNFVMLFKSFSYKNKTFLSPNLQNIVLIVVVCIVLFVASRQLREILLIWLVNKALFHKSFKQSIKTLFSAFLLFRKLHVSSFIPKKQSSPLAQTTSPSNFSTTARPLPRRRSGRWRTPPR